MDNISVYIRSKNKLEVDEVIDITLKRVKLMRNNNKWLFRQIKPYLGNNILEIGSGIGNISEFLATLNENLILTDIDENRMVYLRNKFANNSRIKIILHDISMPGASEAVGSKVDTVICRHVLEHIRNDDAALENMYKILDKGGRLILVVPALGVIYGSLDKQLGHFRRYKLQELSKKLKSKNFIVERIYYLDFIAAFGWFFNACIFRLRIIPIFQSRFFDKLVPFIAKIESKVRIPFGAELVAVCNKR